MKSSVSLHNSVTLKLSEALLIYTADKGNAYATHHKVEGGQIGPANPLTSRFIAQLATSMGHTMDIELLPENVLVRTFDTTVWWTPAQQRTMYFTGDRAESIDGIDGQLYPHPALVWMVRQGNLYVRALISSSRPAADTHLKVAPYWNVNDLGLVCVGSMKRPSNRSVAGLPQWEEGFFLSRFSHPNTPKIIGGADSYLEVLRSIIGGTDFPHGLLLDAKQTLGQFIKGGR